MKSGVAVALGVVAVAVVAGGIYMIDIDQTQEARLPDVDVSVEGGQMPEFDAEVGSVDIVTEEATVEVPDVEVTMQETTIDIPTLEVTPPEEDVASN